MVIGALQKFSLLDYPGKLSCIVFTTGCNFRCGYCHNPELVEISDDLVSIQENELFEFFKSRKGKLDAVVITGGEPTLHKDLPIFIKKVKKLGFLVKLDTNGTNPDMVRNLIDDGLVDYMAMDIKGPLSKYQKIVDRKVDIDKIQESIRLIMKSGVDYEFRTTVVKDQLVRKDFEEIGKLIKGSKRYFLQKFIPTKTNDPSFMQRETYDSQTFQDLVSLLSEDIKRVTVR